ncbi:pre-rRNA processing nucleolar protein [Grosmannia clavigera kw1407]|uniref:Nucleolar protein 56 n=1 Tax=Grosmannia clavigera (strain kw1407 / UAMH 11150) TaxID=655863 RepID=F0XG41_GROCL|nr:pre-rRNA processing nucleolar protein [Grosmannia clavigera kw1407]EFX03386.1 pre-rRNA processing nucleolar protein [Grosmannia clavigera kw1407]
MATLNYLLHESAVGYGIFEVVHQADSVGLRLNEVQDSITDLSKFGKMIKLVNFSPWRNHAEGLQNINDLSEGILPVYLASVLELSLPKASGKKTKVVLGVADRKLAGEITSQFSGIECETMETSEVVANFLRGIRQYSEKLLKGLHEGDVGRAELAMGHAYSRSKVKFNIHKNDNHIIQQIATLDNLDKSINSGCMRVREWYGWHFPELVKIVSDNVTYVKLVLAIGNKKSLTDDKLHDIAAVIEEDGDKAQAILDAAKVSMGQDISETDLEMVKAFATSVTKMAAYRQSLGSALEKKMNTVAPNLQVILGTPVAARLISHAGSLTNLAKYPASTLQILGAEKALFRALKTKGNTPKYGLIYQSSFIGRSSTRHKGRISRYLANKCSIAARVDSFSEQPTSRFGEVMRQQLEDRLEFFSSGKKPMTNEDAMQEAMKKVLADGGSLAVDHEMTDAHEGGGEFAKVKTAKKDKKEKKEKKEKKDKKRKSLDASAMDIDAEVSLDKKKKKKSHAD